MKAQHAFFEDSIFLRRVIMATTFSGRVVDSAHPAPFVRMPSRKLFPATDSSSRCRLMGEAAALAAGFFHPCRLLCSL
jgi:hypothetical protein